MSEPAVFVLIKDGEKRYFSDRWANAFLYREILWGPEELERWLTDGEEDEYFVEECSGGAVVNYDTRELTWCGSEESMSLPRVQRQFQQLLEAAWPGFRVSLAANGEHGLATAAGESTGEDEDDDHGYSGRDNNVREAAGQYDLEEEEDDDDEPFDDETTRAWVTLIGSKGAARHRNLNLISEDLIKPTKAALDKLRDLPAAEVPPEKLVVEGMWIDTRTKEIGYWGGWDAVKTLPRIQKGWKGWTVRWAENGYADQCQVSGLPGVLMSDEEALAQIVPTILSTKRLDIGAFVGAIGGQLKSTAMKATGCLVVVLCIPILLFGYFAEKMQAAGIAAGALVVTVAVLFKLLERRLKKKLSQSPIGDMKDRDKQAEQGRAPVVGPLDKDERRAKLDQLLAASGLPALERIQPHINEDESLDALLG